MEGDLARKLPAIPLQHKLFSVSTRKLERSLHLKGFKIASLFLGFWFRIERQCLVEVYSVDVEQKC